MANLNDFHAFESTSGNSSGSGSSGGCLLWLLAVAAIIRIIGELAG